MHEYNCGGIAIGTAQEPDCVIDQVISGAGARYSVSMGMYVDADPWTSTWTCP